MKIKSINLVNYRNYKNQTVLFGDNCNVISGANAQGKTNVLEAIYIVSTLKSFRNSKLVDCIKDNESQALVIIGFLSEIYGKQKIKFVINREGENEFYFNENKIKKNSDMLGCFYSVIFSPDELKIIKSSPDVRRDFLDTDISQVSKVYCNLLDRYNTILQSRNKLLKNSKYESDLFAELDVWDEQLSIVGSQISLARENFIKKINNHTIKIMKKISQNKESLEIKYVGISGKTRMEKTEQMLLKLKNTRSGDIEVGYTTIGAHRDDLKFFINEIEVKPFASQGQQRSVILALKIAELEVFEQEKESPILLLDDVFSELDGSRQNFLFEYLKDRQVLISSTSLKNKPKYNFVNHRVKNGQVKSINK